MAVGKTKGNETALHRLIEFVGKGLLEDKITPAMMTEYRLPSEAKRKVMEIEIGAKKKKPIWQPNPDHEDGRPNTQRLAYESKADVIGLSGSAGWGKTDLLLGMAINKHKKSAIFRRVYPLLRSIIERSRELLNADGERHAKDSYNESLHRWILDGGKQMIEFESCQLESSKDKQRGRPRDFYAFDEAPDFTRSQYEFITRWNRSPDKNQHCQVVLAFNVPSDDAGSWVIDLFLPWIAYLFPNKYTHVNPAKPGELRWYATVDGKEVEFESGEPKEINGEKIIPTSRTFFFGTLEDNPHYDDAYIAKLQSSPEPLRSQLLYGNFAATSSDNPNQVIPTEWIRAAQRRWYERERPLTPVTSVGVDVARGGNDKTVIARKYDNWFDEPLVYPGSVTYDGPIVAEKVIAALLKPDGTSEEPHCINIDAIGVGSSPVDSLKNVYSQLNPVNVGAGSEYRDKSGKYKMKNLRAEIYWRMREALDPSNGEDIALPPGNELVADLASATWRYTGSAIQIESKDEIKKRIGRSPDIGEAVLLANYHKESWWFWE